MKKCFKCNKEKPLVDFYKHSGMADGFLGKCKDCTKKDVSIREHELRGDNEWVEKEKERSREKYHRLGNKKPTNDAKQKIMKRYNNKYPEKILAKNRSQRIPKKNKENHLHHWSYNPEHYKDIIELSIANHNLAHRHMIYDQEFFMYRDNNNLLLDTKEKHIAYLKNIGIIILQKGG